MNLQNHYEMLSHAIHLYYFSVYVHAYHSVHFCAVDYFTHMSDILAWGTTEI